MPVGTSGGDAVVMRVVMVVVMVVDVLVMVVVMVVDVVGSEPDGHVGCSTGQELQVRGQELAIQLYLHHENLWTSWHVQ